jgi:hypothetical protein
MGEGEWQAYLGMADSVEKSLSARIAWRQFKNARFRRCYAKIKLAPSSERTRFHHRSRSFMGKNRDGAFSTESADSGQLLKGCGQPEAAVERIDDLDVLQSI